MGFPVFVQRDERDCGPSCLKIISKYYGKDFSLPFLRDRCYTQRNGTTILGLCEGAESIGAKTLALKLSWKQLIESAPLPCILHWNNKHFVILYKINKDNVFVSDPAQGRLRYSKEDFLFCWLNKGNFTIVNESDFGTVILFEPTKSFFEHEGVKKHTKVGLLTLLSYLTPYKKYFFLLCLGVLIGSALSLLFPLFTQAVIDIGIQNSDLNFIILILVAQMVAIIGQTANSFIRNWLMLHITNRISISLISDFLGKLMKLPIAFFDTRLVGDILQRIRDFDRIQSFLTSSLISIFMALITLLVYGGVMTFYNLSLFVIFFIGSILYAIWVLTFMKKRRKLDYMRFQKSSEEQSNVIQLITGMQEIKLNNCEDRKRWDWERIQIKLYKINIDSLSLRQIQESGAIFIDNCKNIIISFLAARLVISGDITLGMMMALQFITGQLNAPISQLIGFIQSMQDARISMERLNEIKEKEVEEPTGNNLISQIPVNTNLYLKNVSFQYGGRRSAIVLDDINLEIETNKVTAIVGSSGSGKTTLLKLLLGFYEPTKGSILLNNIQLNRYSPNQWRRNCGIVMQEGFIFSDSIANNINLTDEDIDSDKIEYATKLACIDDYINSLPWRLDTLIGSEGIGLSTGQKQRILIARAVCKNAPYMFLDEATNALDANNELKIITNLNSFFQKKTVVIVAHRLSTVKSADKIVVLDKGKVVEEGKHDELIALKGYYYRLVRNQLELD
jgi:ATP-binding cassette subfamily B protein